MKLTHLISFLEEGIHHQETVPLAGGRFLVNEERALDEKSQQEPLLLAL